MKTTSSNNNMDKKQTYQAPVLRSMDVELEQGIAAGSVGADATLKQQWDSKETQSNTVENVW